MDSLKHKYVALKEAEERTQINKIFKKHIENHHKNNEFLENKVGL